MSDYKIKYRILDALDKENDKAREGFVYLFHVESNNYYKCQEILNWCKDAFSKEKYETIGGSSGNHTNVRTYFEIITLKEADDALLFRLSW